MVPTLVTILLSTLALRSGTAEGDRAQAILLARATLSRTLGVDEARMHVEEARDVEWPDASLGCPQKGTSYAQLVVPGYSVRVKIDAGLHSVHVGGGRAVVCGQEVPPNTEKYMQLVVRVQTLARSDLASRLKVEVQDVKVNRLRPATWPSTSLGCPEAGRSYDPVETRGFVIELVHAGKTYRYHSDKLRAVFCPAR
jgi:hypothetical protein